VNSLNTALRPLAAYGALRLPLALLELPMFVLLPALYHQTYGLSLAVVGGVLFGTRLIDALADPLIGAAIDRSGPRANLRRWVLWGLPPLAIGFAAMLNPVASTEALPLWLALTSLVTYLAYSAVSIAHQTWGSTLGSSTSERTRVTSVRETFGLIGVIAAAALLATGSTSALSVCFVVLALLAALALKAAPDPYASPASHDVPDHRTVRYDAADVANGSGNGSASDKDTGGGRRNGSSKGVADGRTAWREVFGNRAFRWLLGAFVLNGIATAIPATLVLLFVRDVLGASERMSAVFLVAYFLSGALGMPLWVRAARRYGFRYAWLLGMTFSVLAFVWTLGLDRGDWVAFLAVCVLTGLALGSDLAVPSAWLASIIADAGHSGRREGAYFGVWSLATKANLAIAAGTALPLVALFGAAPQAAGAQHGAGTLALSLIYAALPSALKLAAGVLVLLSPTPDHAGRADALSPGARR
jgi:GPH family glycoside/pentoside/hexuronide:cation symporter